MVAAARCNAHILAEDGCTTFRRYTDEMDRMSASVAENGEAMSSLNVPDPIRSRAEHRNQMTPAFDDGDHHRGRASPAGSAARDFKNGIISGRQTEDNQPSCQPVDPAAKARWPPITVKQSQQGAAFSRICLF